MPLYDQIIDDILKKIKDKTLKTGDILPTELELGRQYGVSRQTVRSAMIKLVNEGYLTRVKGKGTFVTKPKLTQESTQFIESYVEEMQNKGLTVRTLVLELGVCIGSDHVCNKLKLPSGSELIRLKRLRYVQPSHEEKPVVLTTVYVPNQLVPELINYDFETFSLYSVFERHGIIVTDVIRELEIKMLYGKTAQLLEAKDGTPAHFISSTGSDSDGKVIEYSESFYPGDRNKFVIKISH